MPETLALILDDKIEKGDVFSVARVAGIMAAKKTSELIPMCHPLNITSVAIDLTPGNNPARVDIEASVRVSGKTGVEMEAMTAVSVAGLTIYDMCKAVDREMTIGEIRLVKKSGGKSGTFIREGIILECWSTGVLDIRMTHHSSTALLHHSKSSKHRAIHREI